MDNQIFFLQADTPESLKISEAIKLYEEGKRKDSYEMFKELQDKNEIMAFYHYANLIKYENAKKAFDYVLQGLNIDSNNYHLLKLSAELFTNHNERSQTATQYLENLNFAYDQIKRAQEIFETDNKVYKESIKKDKVANPGVAVDMYYSQKMELNSLEANIVSVRNSVNVLIRVQQTEQLVIDTEKRLFKERTRLMEILGLFIAIFAFIFTSSQIALNFDLIGAITIITAMGLVLMTFILALHMAINPEERMRKLYYMLAMFIIILVVLPLSPYLYKAIKYWLNLS